MTGDALSAARSIERPTREAMLQRAPFVNQFWIQNRDLFEDAWLQWETSESDLTGQLDSSLYAPHLRNAVELAWKDPSKESM